MIQVHGEWDDLSLFYDHARREQEKHMVMDIATTMMPLYPFYRKVVHI